jgi:FdhD protein
VTAQTAAATEAREALAEESGGAPVIEPLQLEASYPPQLVAPQAVIEAPVHRAVGDSVESASDQLAVEEPLEIRLGYQCNGQWIARSISVTMRTPGQDAELAVGFLLGEGIVRDPGDIESVRPCGPAVGALRLHNVVRVRLRADVAVDMKRLERHFYTTSSCGVCGKTSLEALHVRPGFVLPIEGPLVAAETIHRLPRKLRQSQAVFDHTGGLHAAGLFTASGDLVGLREDVGRHNAVDKLIGTEVLGGRVPLLDKIILVSGRASFELVQKAMMAGAPVMVAVGAPSSLAVELACHFKMTLVGFARDNRFNVYSGEWRLCGVHDAPVESAQ